MQVATAPSAGAAPSRGGASPAGSGDLLLHVPSHEHVGA